MPDYVKIIDLCIGNNIRAIGRTQAKTGTAEDRKIKTGLLEEMEKSNKFRHIIVPNIRTGRGLENGGFVKPPKIIVVPNDQAAQYDRLMVILGSKTAGSSADSFNEFTAILDKLLKDKKIRIKIYKRFLSKYHELD